MIFIIIINIRDINAELEKRKKEESTNIIEKKKRSLKRKVFTSRAKVKVHIQRRGGGGRRRLEKPSAGGSRIKKKRGGEQSMYIYIYTCVYVCTFAERIRERPGVNQEKRRQKSAYNLETHHEHRYEM